MPRITPGHLSVCSPFSLSPYGVGGKGLAELLIVRSDLSH
jgi:hypothetical protein